MLVRLLFALLLFWCSPAMAQVPAWSVSEAGGEVVLQRAGTPQPLRRGTMLAAGDIIQTGPNGRAVLVRNREFVLVSPRSRLRIPSQAETSGGIIQMIQEVGRALYRIERKATPPFGVRPRHPAAPPPR